MAQTSICSSPRAANDPRRASTLFRPTLTVRDIVIGMADVPHPEFRTGDGELISARLLAKDDERCGHEREESETDRNGDHHSNGDRD